MQVECNVTIKSSFRLKCDKFIHISLPSKLGVFRETKFYLIFSTRCIENRKCLKCHFNVKFSCIGLPLFYDFFLIFIFVGSGCDKTFIYNCTFVTHLLLIFTTLKFHKLFNDLNALSNFIKLQYEIREYALLFHICFEHNSLFIFYIFSFYFPIWMIKLFDHQFHIFILSFCHHSFDEIITWKVKSSNIKTWW